jgi:hypothetical protein
MTLRAVRDRVKVDFDEAVLEGDIGRHEVSVWTFSGLYADEIVRVARALNGGIPPHNRMQTATAGAMRALGLEVLRTEPSKPGHHAVRFPSTPSDTDIHALMAAFSRPRLTPREDHDVSPSS